MLKLCRRRTHAIVIIFVVFFSISIKGIAQTEDNKIRSKEQNTKNQLLPKILTKKKNKIPVVKKKVNTKKLSSNLVKTSSEIKSLKNKLLLVTRQLTTAKKSDTQKDIKIKKLQSESAKFTGKIKTLEKNLSLAKTELEGLKETDAKKSEKYKEIIKCYRSALFAWNNLISRQGLTEKEYLVFRVELRRSLFACPPI